MITSQAANGIALRQIEEHDHSALTDFLAPSFGYPSSFFTELFEKLRYRETPAALPKYGYLLQNDEKLVGCLLLIFTPVEQAGKASIRCHVTSWFVEPEYRPMASLYFSRALKLKGVDYLNVSARPWVRPIIENQGFRKYSNGQFLMSTWVNALVAARRSHAKIVDSELPQGRSSDFERKLMRDHAEYGCICLWCVEGDEAFPFVFHQRPFKRILPGVQLVYCRDMESFVRYARPIARYLAARGQLLLRVDANGPIKDLVGTYLDGVDPRFAKGNAPRQGDLAYTQMAMCPFTRARSR
jgi:hypothetical protein